MTRHICQGPECHTYKTQSRIRGVKGSKVLRTRPARYDMTTHSWGYIWERYFCDERCMQNWLAKHLTQLMTVVGINTKPNENITRHLHISMIFNSLNFFNSIVKKS